MCADLCENFNSFTNRHLYSDLLGGIYIFRNIYTHTYVASV